jgi:hypothetical protein
VERAVTIDDLKRAWIVGALERIEHLVQHRVDCHPRL